MKVAVIGSCVSRDTFEHRPHALELSGYWARTSWVSQVRPPVAEVPSLEALRPLEGWRARMVQSDLDKTVLQRAAATGPDVLLVDLIDERFRLARLDGTVVTYSTHLAETSLRSRLTGTPGADVDSDERVELFADAVSRAAPRLRARMPDVRVVVHRALFATRAVGDARFDEEALERAERVNGRLAVMYDALAAAFDGEQWQAPDDVVLADPDHKWGLDHYHYVGGYYEALLQHLEAMPAPTR